MKLGGCCVPSDCLCIDKGEVACEERSWFGTNVLRGATCWRLESDGVARIVVLGVDRAWGSAERISVLEGEDLRNDRSCVNGAGRAAADGLIVCWLGDACRVTVGAETDGEP